MDVSSYIAIGGWFIQVIFDKYLSSKLQTWATNSGIGDDLDKLRIAMLRIQSVVSNAEGNLAGGMLGWMKEFRDVSYDAEDLLDELEYRRFQQELEAGSSSPVREFLSNLGVVRGITTQASGSLSSRLSNFTGGDDAANQVTDASLSSRMNSPRPPASPEVTWDRATKARIRNIVERLNQVASCVSEALRLSKLVHGGPVAAKAVAGLLKNKLDADEWIKVLESNDIWNDIMPVLDFSYQHLPAHLQRCFAYCSIFPKYWKFKADELVHLWMAQGYIQPQNKKLMEDIGREYLNDLLCRSFFDTHKNGPITYYVMHDLLHDLAETVSLDECLRIEDEPTNAPLSTRHLSVRIEKLANLKGVCQLRNLRTLILFSRNQSVIDHPVLKDVFKDFHCIRTLDLSFCKMEKLPEVVGHLIHLRYLNLSSTSIRVLPESLCRLYNLQVLNLQGCRLQVLPSGMNKLINLRHLTAAHQIVTTIAGIGRLTCLQQLQVFRVRREVGYEIGQLKDLNELRGLLQIRNLENVETENEASEAMLDVKEHLSMLQLVWDSSRRNGGAEMEVQVIESLRPHPNLKRLEIRGCRVAKSPGWLETELLNNLEFIYLSGCRFWECLPPFGKMPSLKVLWLQGMHAVKRVGPELEGNGDKVFPCLEELVLDDLPELEVLSGDEQLFFSLHSVMVKDCIKLKSLPPFPPNITQLTIANQGSPLTIANQGFWIPYYDDARMAQISSAVSSLCICNCPMLTARFSALLKEKMVPSFSSVRSINMLRSFSSLRSLNIGDISLLTVPPVRKSLCSLENLDIQDCHETTFSTEQQEVFQQLTSLQSLCISNCANLQFLPEDLNSLSSLQKLFLWNCPSIQSMPEKGLPISLKVLEIESCHPLLKERCKKEQGIDWQRIAHISHIEIDGEVL